MTTQNIFDLVDTWNDGATTFTAIKMDVTDTTSNAASLLMDLKVGSASKLSILKSGRIQGDSSAPYIVLSNAVGAELSYGNTRLLNGGQLDLYSSTNPKARISITGQYIAQMSGSFCFTSADSNVSSIDTLLTRRGIANLRLGAADAAAPVAQKLSVQSVVAGTSNTAGGDLTITGSQSTGSDVGGSIIFQTAAANSGGGATVQNTLANAMVIDSVKTVRLGTGYTVATLPAAGTAGRRTYVTDATAPTFLGTLTGGGAVVCPVFDNGTAWVSA